MKAELHRVLAEAPFLGAITADDFARAAFCLAMAASLVTLVTLTRLRSKQP
jgi:hypothetical protein